MQSFYNLSLHTKNRGKTKNLQRYLIKDKNPKIAERQKVSNHFN